MQEGRWTTLTPSQFTHEREALAYLQTLLPDTEPYRAWSNFTFTAQTGHPYEVDLLVAAPGGLYLVEIKSWAGRLTSSGSNWLLHGPNGTRTFDNPLHLADAKAKKLKSLLQVAASRRRGQAVRIPFVQAAVFLSKPGLTIELADHHLHGVYGPEPVEGRRGKLDPITSLLLRQPDDERRRVTREVSAALPDLLADVGIARSRRHYQVGAWELETRPFDVGPTWQDHRARHRDLEREHRRVRIYLVERNAAQAARASIERAARREMSVLHGISHPGIVQVYSMEQHEAGPALIFRHDPRTIRLDRKASGSALRTFRDVPLGSSPGASRVAAPAHSLQQSTPNLTVSKPSRVCQVVFTVPIRASAAGGTQRSQSAAAGHGLARCPAQSCRRRTTDLLVRAGVAPPTRR